MSTAERQGAERSRIYEVYENTYEADVVNFVPGEMCIATPLTPGLNVADMYRVVRETLNRRIASALGGRSRKGDVPADDRRTTSWAASEDLSCPLLAERYHRDDLASNREILLPLRRAERGANAAIALPRADGTTTFLGFYQLDRDVAIRPDPTDLSDRWQARRQYLVGLVFEAVRLINLSSDVRTGRPGEDLLVLAATPNWLTIGAHNSGGSGCGSPGGVPVAVAKGHAPPELSRLFSFTHPILNDFDDRAQAVTKLHADGAKTAPSGVVVVVLDTSPSPADLKRAVASPDIADEDKWLLRLVQQQVHLEGPLSAPEGSFDHLSYLPNWHGPERDHVSYPSLDDFRMPDHGLFVAGTIYHLAPDSEIHLLRVLGDHGVGDLNTIAATLAALPERFLKLGDGRRLIANLSLGAELPMSEKFAVRWFPYTTRAHPSGTIGVVSAAIGQFRDLLHRSLQEAIDSVIEQGVLVVAAVGNDHYIPPIGPKEPRYPAAYARVVGVAAVQTNDVPADYTNLGDVFVPQVLNNAATFGGNATLPGGLPGNGPAVTDNSPNAIRGVFTAPDLPLQGGANQTGWVAWAGTSFATPIISAIAANVWADHLSGAGALDVDGVVASLRALHAPGLGGGVPVVDVAPV